jgi:hypothetical protein
MKVQLLSINAINILRIITEIFTLQINFIFAANPTEIHPITSYSVCVTCSKSASDLQENAAELDFTSLSPTTPAEATFTDEKTTAAISLAPVTPSEATFSNDHEFLEPSTQNDCDHFTLLAPVTPKEARFDD